MDGVMMTDTALHVASGKVKAGNVVFPAFLSFVYRLIGVGAVSILLVMITVPIAVQAAESCDTSRGQIGVRYEQQIHDLDAGTTTGHVMELWRDGDRVMHVYPDRGLAEQWEHPGKGALHLTVWFDEDLQGIEYMPEDIGSRSDPRRWAEKWQLVPDNMRQTLQLRTTSGTGCELTRKLVKDAPDRQVSLEWNVPLQLPTRYTVRTKGRVEIWEAREIVTDPQKVRQVFDRRTAYKTTDFIDIGDNESDPFLRKMINLGFVSHGASGFYDADGHALEGRGHPH